LHLLSIRCDPYPGLQVFDVGLHPGDLSRAEGMGKRRGGDAVILFLTEQVAVPQGALSVYRHRNAPWCVIATVP